MKPQRIKLWLDEYNKEAKKVLRRVALDAWNLFTSASPITRQYLDEAEDVARAFCKHLQCNCQVLFNFK